MRKEEIVLKTGRFGFEFLQGYRDNHEDNRLIYKKKATAMDDL